jgi:hypothetical protein
MKNSTNEGFDQHYNAQVAVDQGSLLIVANTVSQAANDKQEAVPTVDARDERVGKPEVVALDGVPIVLVAGIGRSRGRRVSGVSGVQCQALA